MDTDALALFGKLAENIYSYIAGDPKQSMKYSKAFREFTENARENDTVFHVLPANKVTRRIPECHLQISNLFYPVDEQQTTISDAEGKLYYLYATDDNFLKLYEALYAHQALIYIRQETDKEKMRLYVALTRSKSDLIFVIDKSGFS